MRPYRACVILHNESFADLASDIDAPNSKIEFSASSRIPLKYHHLFPQDQWDIAVSSIYESDMPYPASFASNGAGIIARSRFNGEYIRRRSETQTGGGGNAHLWLQRGGSYGPSSEKASSRGVKTTCRHAIFSISEQSMAETISLPLR